MVPADGKTQLIIEPEKQNDATYDVEVRIAQTNERTAFIQGLILEPTKESPISRLLEDQMIEGAAQAAAVVQLDSIDDDKLPLLLKIGKAEFSDEHNVRAGDNVTYEVVSSQLNKRAFSGNVGILSEGKMIGTIENIQAMTAPAKTLLRIIET